MSVALSTMLCHSFQCVGSIKVLSYSLYLLSVKIERNQAYEITLLLSVSFQPLNQLTIFHETWYEHMSLEATPVLCFSISCNL